MTHSTKSIALRIALLLEEHTEKEIENAVSLLHKHGYDSILLSYLAKTVQIGGSKRRIPQTKENRHKPLDESTSRAVLKLREIDPEKYRVLREFDLMVRRGQILSTNEDVRRFGEHVSKGFEPRKSRKETIGPLMDAMSERSMHEIDRLVKFAISFGVEGNTDEYQRLAQYLIKGAVSDN